jgi:hypothetical protein
MDRAATPAAGVDLVARPVRPSRPLLVLWMLCGIYVLNFLDRSLLSILAKPIQDSLHITDGSSAALAGCISHAPIASSPFRSAGWPTGPTESRSCPSPARLRAGAVGQRRAKTGWRAGNQIRKRLLKACGGKGVAWPTFPSCSLAPSPGAAPKKAHRRVARKSSPPCCANARRLIGRG